MKPLAIVTPWFGRNLKGGAEQQSWQVATRLAQRGHTVEVLTTCSNSFHDDWAVNHLPVGLSQEQGVKIRRFQAPESISKLFPARRNADDFGNQRDYKRRPLNLPGGAGRRHKAPFRLREAANLLASYNRIA